MVVYFLCGNPTRKVSAVVGFPSTALVSVPEIPCSDGLTSAGLLWYRVCRAHSGYQLPELIPLILLLCTWFCLHLSWNALSLLPFCQSLRYSHNPHVCAGQKAAFRAS